MVLSKGYTNTCIFVGDGSITYKNTVITKTEGKTCLVFGTVAVTNETDVTLPVIFKDTNYVIIAWYKWNDAVVRQNAEPKTNSVATFTSNEENLHSASYIAIGEVL